MKNRSPAEIVDYNISVYKNDLVNEDGSLNEPLLRALCENVEREARNAAVKTAFACANAISSGVDVGAELDRLSMIDHHAEQNGFADDPLAAFRQGN